MKIGVHAATIALLAASASAQAVTLNPRGLGQALVYPYYTVLKNQDTLISVGNASGIGKVAKVVVQEGRNGRPALYFNLFLSPHDVWTARLSRSDDGGARLFTNDSSCTYPDLVPDGTPMRVEGYVQVTPGQLYPGDGGPTGLERTREGMLTIIAMGDVVPGSDLEATITHVGSGQPGAGVPACDAAVIGFHDFADLTAPGNDLYGSASVVNVGEGTFFAYAADALADFTDVAIDRGTSQERAPSFDFAHSSASTQGGAIAHVADDTGATRALDYANPASAVSAVYMAESIANEYLVATGLGANTDWVVSFPTRSHHVDALYTDAAIAPFVEAASEGLSAVAVVAQAYDQEEGSAAEPGAETTFDLPYQVNVLSVGAPLAGAGTSRVFGSTLSTPVAAFGEAGWMQLGLGGAGHVLSGEAGGVLLSGLPVTGFMVYNIINSNAAPGRLANYGGTFAHRSRFAEAVE